MSTQLSQIARKAKCDRQVRFTSLAHLLTPEFLEETWGQMNRRAAGGIDGESCEQFESELEQRVQEINQQLRAGTYRAPPVRRVEIPKGPGKVGTRPLGIPTVSDRLLQRAVARILEAVFEADFLECSYGFRPGRSPHHALRALRLQIVTKKVRYIAEADIRGYFTHVSHRWLRQMVAHRIADPVILSLIGKWLNAGAMQDGVVLHTDDGTPQGGPISCVLSNLYLHHSLDLWFERKFKRQCHGEAYLVRFVDDFLQFGRFAAADRAVDGVRPEAFEFLGFRHVCGVDRSGKFTLVRIPSVRSCRKFLARTHEWLGKHQNWKRRDQQQRLRLMLQGFYQYFGLQGRAGNRAPYADRDRGVPFLLSMREMKHLVPT